MTEYKDTTENIHISSEDDITFTQELIDLLGKEPKMIVESEGKWHVASEDDLHFCEHVRENGPLPSKYIDTDIGPAFNCKDANFYNVQAEERDDAVFVTISHI